MLGQEVVAVESTKRQSPVQLEMFRECLSKEETPIAIYKTQVIMFE